MSPGGAEREPLRLAIDATRCDGHGICMLRCPERIGLDEWGFAIVDRSPIEEPTLRRRAGRAVAACPEGALRLEPVTVRSPGDAAPARML